MFTSVTYQKLDNMNRHFVGFLFTPIIISFIIACKVASKKDFSDFEREFFKILMQKTILKLSIVLSITLALLLLLEPDLLILNIVVLSINFGVMISTIYSIKKKMSILFQLSKHKNELVLN